jgi:hypothetical protein
MLPVGAVVAKCIGLSRQFTKFADENFSKKSAIKRDGPVFFFSAPVKVVGDENTEQEAADG